MKSLFADFLQNVTPPGAFKRVYTVFFTVSGRRKMAQFVIKEHFGHVTPNRVDMKMGPAKPGAPTNSWTTD